MFNPNRDGNQEPTVRQDDQPSHAANVFLAQVIEEAHDWKKTLPAHFVLIGECFIFGLRQAECHDC